MTYYNITMTNKEAGFEEVFQIKADTEDFAFDIAREEFGEFYENFRYEATPAEINKALQIVKIGHDLKWPDGKNGYFTVSGYCFNHPGLGYYALEGAKTPYIPQGGKSALNMILESGGFTNFEDCEWLQPMN